ncbi:PREDICTED: LOW QUALITY PROTEIN: mitochondrial peptide methionine sulfoxide reductase-like [Haliaeetus leucocephalus]|uniref:LOW QUALITY PROTEIN: mitochondrial peptide methionine sulfoxide reductase-like n=1 Tax=Haliaeetus leucocephalus TaxID=52644 RepID=UPI00053CBFF4|nr:PREDICTED: LOW QUALITY PROTEIN: mitochondrial peptide methionine sulfoxide reductase-like [Haliaeetus leucocephalus]
MGQKPATHAVNGNPTVPSFPAETQTAIFGMGCFWGAEQLFWKMPGVFSSTQVGYAGGFTPNPIYEEVCTGLMEHAEVVRVIFNPWKLSYKELLKVFWENHDPTQGKQQQEDLSTRYRSVIYTLGPQQQAAALRSREVYRQVDGDTGTPPGDTGTPPGDTGHRQRFQAASGFQNTRNSPKNADAVPPGNTGTPMLALPALRQPG